MGAIDRQNRLLLAEDWKRGISAILLIFDVFIIVIENRHVYIC